MSVIDQLPKQAARARYAAAQGLRGAYYATQYLMALRQSSGVTRPGEPPFRPSRGKPSRRALRTAYFDAFRQDRANIEAGLYRAPRDLSLDTMPTALQRVRRFLADVADVDRRRRDRDGTEVRRSEAADPQRYPAYYRQNFHYQSGGWLSDDSAALYDHQVEVLFTGAAGAMRRAALADVAKALAGRDQRDVSLLDLACGTGAFLAETLRNYPRLKATGIDLSPNYCAHASEAVADWPQAEIVQGQAESLPLDDDSQDIVVCIYLFHELPPRVRPAVLAEVKRVLKPGGTFVLADSLQFGDRDGVDGFLEYFPEGFHEPYYRGYLSWDLDAAMAEAGFTAEAKTLSFLTKVTSWRPADEVAAERP